jgi:hypothetical protein
VEAAGIEPPIRVGLRFLCVTFALTAVLLAGCGSGDDRAQVEDSLRNYLGAVNPEQTSFPVGAGIPRVRRNACKDGHVKVQKGELLSDAAGVWSERFPEEVALWSCVITFGSVVQQATVAVTGSTKVVWAVALPLEAFPVSETAHTYAGITCRWPPITTPDDVAICQLATETGFAVAVARRFVIVLSWKTGKRVFVRNQSDQSPGFGPLNDKRIFHSEAHRGIVCYWSRAGGGTALCSRADRHGYLAGVSRSAAIVLNEHSKIVFLRNHS